VAASAGLLALGAACAFEGCTNNVTALAYTPITGIVIRSQDLIAGHGCGTGRDQVYAYIAVLAQQNFPDQPFESTVVFCYSDAVLSNLVWDAGPDMGTGVGSETYYNYKLYIYAYNYESFPKALACTPPVSDNTCPGDSLDAAAAATTAHPPTWTTTCTAEEIAGEPELAHCKPLEPTAPPDASAPD
jgi:hypothetical protein